MQAETVVVSRAEIDAELQRHLKEQFPDVRIMFLGDSISAFSAEAQEDSLVNGTCVGCGVQMSNYPEMMFPARWKPEPGWTPTLHEASGEMSCWSCHTCSEES